ncbi:MAG: hypothetical protein AMJ61_07715 [Desulfobacterales bacterium SG8_35_2]|nr:MAG: hypothetical protein AMJ61_07715 [Desulfobacterales bacterium SG8_35_2]
MKFLRSHFFNKLKYFSEAFEKCLTFPAPEEVITGMEMFSLRYKYPAAKVQGNSNKYSNY